MTLESRILCAALTMFCSHLIVAFAAAWLYARGRAGKSPVPDGPNFLNRRAEPAPVAPKVVDKRILP